MNPSRNLSPHFSLEAGGKGAGRGDEGDEGDEGEMPNAQ